MKQKWIVFLLSCCLLYSCTYTSPAASSVDISSEVSAEFSSSAPSESQSESQESPSESYPSPVAEENHFVRDLSDQIVSDLQVDSSQGEQGIRVLYEYLVENVYLADPVGLDVWRYLSNDTPAIPFLENRALSPLYFHIGSCEDFASAMVLLLESAGYEAQYVSGFTLSVNQEYIDHAWTVVKLDGVWYHLDSQLEQNVVRNNMLKYRFYLKSDTTMAWDHKWGENIITSWSFLTPNEIQIIKEDYLYPTCPTDWESLTPISISLPSAPNYGDIEFEISQMKQKSGKINLSPLTLNVNPPILVPQHHITPLLNDQSP